MREREVNGDRRELLERSIERDIEKEIIILVVI